ncbi:rna binding protein, partial [Nannochloropsis gaditana CCMP526]
QVNVAPDPQSGEDENSGSLALLPTKFRKLIWVKRGDFVIVSGTSHDFQTAAGEKGKVKFMVEHILYKEQVKHLKDQGMWPVVFSEPAEQGPAHKGEGRSELEHGANQRVEPEGGGQEKCQNGNPTRERVGREGDGNVSAFQVEDGDSTGSQYESDEEDYSDLHVNTNRLAKAHLYVDDDEEEEEAEADKFDEGVE